MIQLWSFCGKLWTFTVIRICNRFLTFFLSFSGVLHGMSGVKRKRLKPVVLQSHYRSGWKQSGSVRCRVLFAECCSLSLHMSKSSMGCRGLLCGADCSRVRKTDRLEERLMNGSRMHCTKTNDSTTQRHFG